MIEPLFWPPSGMTNAVALPRSGLIRTSVTVTLAFRRSGSRAWLSRRISTSTWRSSSPTRSCRWLGPTTRSRPLSRRRADTSQILKSSGQIGRRSDDRARDLLDIERLDHVADFDIFVILERHAAFETFTHFAHFFLEAAQSLQRALVDDHVVAQQANLGAAADHAFGDHTAGDLAGLGDHEDLPDLGIAQEVLADSRGQHARQHRL